VHSKAQLIRISQNLFMMVLLIDIITAEAVVDSVDGGVMQGSTLHPPRAMPLDPVAYAAVELIGNRRHKYLCRKFYPFARD
jgi:hypothetical protein